MFQLHNCAVTFRGIIEIFRNCGNVSGSTKVDLVKVAQLHLGAVRPPMVKLYARSAKPTHHDRESPFFGVIAAFQVPCASNLTSAR